MLLASSSQYGRPWLGLALFLPVLLGGGPVLSVESPPPGISGMASIGQDSFLAVHDLKSFEDGMRVSVIRTSSGKNYETVPVQVAGWEKESRRSSDLEAVCSLSQHNNQYLLVESGSWNGRKGRLFHISFDEFDDPLRATLIKEYELPIFNAKGNDPEARGDAEEEGDEFEGLACIHRGDGQYLILLAERGGSGPFPHGIIRWFYLEPQSNKGPEWTAAGRKGVTVIAPGSWPDPLKNRDISALHVQDDTLWAAASYEFEGSEEDPRTGTTGSFYSVIYRIGDVDVNADVPIRDYCADDTFDCTGEDSRSPYKVWREIAGFKVEGLAGPPQSIGRSALSFGTEDERFGGVWRPIR